MNTALDPTAIPLALYVHIPWCVRKCPYCDFNSHESEQIPEAEYVRALCADLDREAELAGGRALSSVFIGGGTPSLFSARAIAAVLAHADQRLGLSRDCEITLEANPGTAEQARFAGYRAAGVNRLSLGVQSFQPRHLQALGRIHSADEAERALTMARRAGFDNLNLDLMHGLPDQTPADAVADLDRAIALGPEHLSWYQLTLEPNTAFYKQPPALPEDDALASIQDQGEARLAAAGYRQYEVSAYGRDNRHSRHNLNYWTFGDYLGIGAGAHGKISTASGIVRRHKTRLPRHYLDAVDPLAGAQPISAEALPFEFLLNALRLVEGVPAAQFPARTGLTLAALEPGLSALRQEGLLQADPERLAATAAGLRFLNDVLARFLPD